MGGVCCLGRSPKENVFSVPYPEVSSIPYAVIFITIFICHYQVDPNDPNYDSDSTEPKGPSANGTKRTIKLNTMVW